MTAVKGEHQSKELSVIMLPILENPTKTLAGVFTFFLSLAPETVFQERVPQEV